MIKLVFRHCRNWNFTGFFQKREKVIVDLNDQILPKDLVEIEKDSWLSNKSLNNLLHNSSETNIPHKQGKHLLPSSSFFIKPNAENCLRKVQPTQTGSWYLALEVQVSCCVFFVLFDWMPSQRKEVGIPLGIFMSRNRTNVPTSLGQVNPNTAAAGNQTWCLAQHQGATWTQAD